MAKVRRLSESGNDEIAGLFETTLGRQSTASMKRYYATFRRRGSRWDPNKTARAQPFWDEHARFMDALFDQGAIILGGPFADGTGALVVVQAESAALVHEMFRGDPWTEHDVLLVGDVKEWIIFLDAREKK
jgi:uncharacterized protein